MLQTWLYSHFPQKQETEILRRLLADFNKLSSWKQSSNFNTICRTLFSGDRPIAPQTRKLKRDFTLFDRTDMRAFCKYPGTREKLYLVQIGKFLSCQKRRPHQFHCLWNYLLQSPTMSSFKLKDFFSLLNFLRSPTDLEVYYA